MSRSLSRWISELREVYKYGLKSWEPLFSIRPLTSLSLNDINVIKNMYLQFINNN